MESNVFCSVNYKPQGVIKNHLPFKRYESGYMQLDRMVGRNAVNNEILLMLVDTGYYNILMSNYLYGELHSIPNVAIAVLDKKMYHVLAVL